MTPVEISKSIAGGTFTPNTYLTNLSLAAFQAEDDYAATKLFPIVPVALPSGKYFRFSSADLARDGVQLKPAFGRVQPSQMGLSEDTYDCRVEQLIIGIDQIGALPYSRIGAPGAADPRVGKVRAAMEQAKLHLDARFAQSFFNASAWSNVYSGVSGAPSGKQFKKFSEQDADPVMLVDKLIMDIRRNGRRKPNKIALGMETFIALKHSPAILDRVKYSGEAMRPATVNEGALAQLFGVDRVVVLASSYNSAALGEDASMEFVCDPKGMLICYAPDHPAIDEPSAGYTFAWDMLGGGQYIAMSQWEGENGTHSEYVEALMACDMKKTSDELAVYLTDCV
ncbi:MAG: hypothetical protein ACOYIH_08305 [Candidatus Fimadaptatus sp.]|jgi:hypothetical protein